jgi:hypothetical protein
MFEPFFGAHMRRTLILGLLLTLVGLPNGATVQLGEFLEKIEARDIRILESESFYDSIVELMIEQPLDHRHPEGKKFSQRLYISHFDPSRPVVFVTEGYDAEYYYTSEIATRLRCNQVIAEHRYYGRSVPDSLDWRYLDTWQAASDHHRIVQLFRELYPEQWITTGISKGGQSVIYHSYYYPEDVEVRVPYVAPLNFAVEDKRIYSFLDRVGTPSDRRKVRKFQGMALRHQERYIPAFEEFSGEKGYTYEIAGGIEKAFEYCVLEYSFAFWQWGYVPARKIPGWAVRPGKVVEHMNRVAGFDYFSDEFFIEHRPFFYQALTEMGYYGYDLDEFRKYIRHVDNPLFTFTLPEGLETRFNPDLSVSVERYLREEAENFIYIYGEYDTWSATAVTGTGSTNSRIFVKEGGSHRTRINNMPETQREEVYRTLEAFLR